MIDTRSLPKRLLLLNTTVYVVVLALFSYTLYLSMTRDFKEEQKRRLYTLSDTVMSSFQALEVNHHDAVDKDIPDIFEHAKATTELHPRGATLQWFDKDGRLVATRGKSAISVPFLGDSFQEQDEPHALVVTRPVNHHKVMVGYLRAAISQGNYDSFRHRLITGLVTGFGVALVAASIGVFWLMRLSLRPVQQVMENLSQFTADASHELRNPLMAIKTNASVALRHVDGMRDKDREKFEAILSAVDQVIGTTGALLQLAQTEQNARLDDITTFDLANLIAQIISELKPLAESKSISMVNSVSPELFMMARTEDMKSLVGNVLENAIQYTNAQGSVSLSAYRQGKRIVIEVKDDGIGINSDELPKIFHRFWRSDKARTHSTGGSGLGLAIVRAILNRYEGSITLDSTVGSGTLVTMTLPAVQRSLLHQASVSTSQ